MARSSEQQARRRLADQTSLLLERFQEFYRPPVGAYDELLGPEGIRPHWQGFMTPLSSLSFGDLNQRWEVGQNLLRDNGVTYNVYGDREGLNRPWSLDPLPLILSNEEWKRISAAIAQRATLLNAILADLYGPRSLIANGLIPPQLLYANPAFLRPCHGWMPAGGRYLHLYAADLRRGPDGQWRVVADRTESPAGAGYALENRTVISRVLPDFFRSLHVQRLGPFFDALRRSLHALSPRRSDEPRVVLLTPGPYNETYFEHAFLARHLGITLVQSEDLTVRDNLVYMKTLTGLQQVDVIFRRTNGDWCDPLEFRGDSTLGIAGLAQAARRGSVALVNALGSGLLDGSAITAFLPRISRWLMGQDLTLPSINAWWCGNESDCCHVLENLPSLAVRPAFHNRIPPKLGNEMTREQRAELASQIQSRPWDWVAQELGGMSTVPVWNDGQLDAQHMVLRVLAVATDHGWEVMPGGLARVSDERDLLTARLQSGGGGSKDVWVQADLENPAPSIIRTPQRPVRLVRGNRDLPSRVADNMFWFGRYLERTEHTTRLLRTALQRLEEALDQGDSPRALYLTRMMGKLGLTLPSGIVSGNARDIPARLVNHHILTTGNGLAAHVDRLIRVMGTLRDRLSGDTWRALQILRDEIEDMSKMAKRGDVQRQLNRLILTVEAVAGLSSENMTRGPLWVFMDSGRRAERAISIIDCLGGALCDAEDEESVPMDMLLELADSVMTYRSRYLASPRLAGVLDLLLCDESNPRSLAFQVQSLADHMNRLAVMAGENGFYRPEQKLLTVISGITRTMDIMVLAQYDRDGGYHEAERLLEAMRSRFWELSTVLSREYFTHAEWRLPIQPLEMLL